MSLCKKSNQQKKIAKFCSRSKFAIPSISYTGKSIYLSDMRKLLWLCLFFGGYVWMVTTGNEQFVIERGKALYKLIADWLQDADVDFHFKDKKSSSSKRERHRRWD